MKSSLVTQHAPKSGAITPAWKRDTMLASLKPKGISLRRLAVACLSAFAMAVSNSCTETSAPVEALIVARLAPISPTLLTGIVGSNVENPPSVLVEDGNGRPAAGVIVQFRITNGGGTLSSATAKSNALGIATLSSWTLGISAGVHFVTATTGLLSATFRATALAGAPVTIAKLTGDNQIALRGSAVAVRPGLKVADAYDNPTGGIPVSFVVEAGGGTLTGGNVTTDSLGIATLGSWILGAAGDQSVVATIGGLTPLTFRATAIEPPLACAAAAQLSIETPVRSQLNVDACRTPDGRFFKTYLVMLADKGTWTFEVASDEFDTHLELRDSSGTPIASSRNSSSANNSAVKAMLLPGVVTLVVTSVNPAATGNYDVSYTSSTTNVAGCEVSIVRGVQSAQNVGPGECTPTGAVPTDRYRIYMTAGSRVSIVLLDYSLGDNHLQMQDDSGQILAMGFAKDYVESGLSYSAPTTGYYVISVQVQWRYTLDVQ